jgi:hypothetical protein
MLLSLGCVYIHIHVCVHVYIYKRQVCDTYTKEAIEVTCIHIRDDTRKHQHRQAQNKNHNNTHSRRFFFLYNHTFYFCKSIFLFKTILTRGAMNFAARLRTEWSSFFISLLPSDVTCCGLTLSTSIAIRATSSL